MPIKRLFLDIEVSPNVGFFWSPGHKISLSYDNIIEERAIICICWQWEGGKVHSLTWDKRKSDRKMLLSFVKEMNQADEMIGHNLDKFDLAWIRTRCFFHSIPISPKFVTVDTLKECRRLFRFNSNRLDYVSKFSGNEGKIHTDFGMWKAITLKNDKTALDKMVKYCKGDVSELRKVFNEIRNYLPAKSHVSGVRVDCPECGGKTKVMQTRVLVSGTVRKQRVCKNCGKYHTTNK
jgi:DNA polymerase elongation subunit (family B)